MNPSPSIPDWARQIVEFDRAALAKAVTLVESTRDEDLETASQLLRHLPDPERPAFRLGVTGAPGAGKSTLIDGVGMKLCDRGRRIAVLAIDPSSSISGGSILGDKTRMHRLSLRPEAFIRATPSANVLGGIGLATAPAIRLCEAAGCDVVVIETVGAGQGELGVADVADAILVLIDPCGGDSVQAIKKGVLELADFVAITKADGELRSVAEATFHEFERSLPRRESRCPGRSTDLILTSAEDGLLLNHLVERIANYENAIRPHLHARRIEQSKQEFLSALRHLAVEWILDHPETIEAAERFAGGGAPGIHPISAAKAGLASRVEGRDQTKN